MNDEFRKLADEAYVAAQKAETTKLALEQAQRACKHDWTIVYDPIITEGYQEPEFKRGSDFSPSFWVSGTTTPRWKRTCSECGLIETTQQTQDKVEKTPVFTSDPRW